MATAKEIKEILVKEYSYQKQDFVGSNGKNLNYKQLESLLKKEQQKEKELSKVETKEITHLDEFDEEVIIETATKFSDDDLIMVMAGINGQLVHHSPVGNGQYKFNGFGQKQTMPYKELKAVNNLLRGTLESGWIIILNRDLIKEFNLEEEYTKFLTPKKAREILSLGSVELEELIPTLPKSMKTTLLDVAKSEYNIGELDSASTIKTLEKIYDVSFDDNLPIKEFKVR